MFHGVMKGKKFYLEVVRASLVAQSVKNLPAVQETWVWSLGWEDSPGEGNGNPLHHPYLENLMDRGACGLQSMGLQRVGHDWATNTYLLKVVYLDSSCSLFFSSLWVSVHHWSCYSLPVPRSYYSLFPLLGSKIFDFVIPKLELFRNIKH